MVLRRVAYAQKGIGFMIIALGCAMLAKFVHSIELKHEDSDE